MFNLYSCTRAYRCSIYIVVLEHFIWSDVLISYYFLKFAFMYPNGLLLHFIHGGSIWSHFSWMFGCVLEACLISVTYNAPAAATFVSILKSNSLSSLSVLIALIVHDIQFLTMIIHITSIFTRYISSFLRCFQ